MPDAIKVFIGAENIVSPLGFSASANFSACLGNKSGIASHSGLGLTDEPVWVSRLKAMPSGAFSSESRIMQFLLHSVVDSISQTTLSLEKNTRVALIISTTKGDMEAFEKGDFVSAEPANLLKKLAHALQFAGQQFVVSNACVSGAQALILAHDMVATGRVAHVIVTGADLVSRFTVTGFQSLFAMSKDTCRPFCKTRSGISLGEGAATLVVSSEREIFKENCFQLLGGATSNDANHISGPSRAGEGLYRAIQRTLANAEITPQEIDFISAHGTATLYNDDMESVAFSRAGMSEIPMNSFKGYFGHTLGAAGLIETAISLQSMKRNILLKCAGMSERGTAQPINVLEEHLEKHVKLMLKSASGFGGCNAALLIKNENAL